MQLSILTDSNTWFNIFAEELKTQLRNLGHEVQIINNIKDLNAGEICFILSFSKILDTLSLKKNKNNIVVHASDLPDGKGFSPMQWTILNGNNEIKLTLFEATEELDSGPYYLKDKVVFKGYELYEEMRQIIGFKIVDMCIQYINNKESFMAKEQKGVGSIFRKRTLADDEIDPSKSIIDQFNHLRIADNENYPVYFFYNGKKYFIKISRDQSFE